MSCSACSKNKPIRITPNSSNREIQASKLSQIKGALKGMKKVVTGGLAQDQEVNNRINICINCKEYLASYKRCSQCGCFIKLKTKIAEEQCPLGKW